MTLVSTYSLIVLAALMGAQIWRPFCAKRQVSGVRCQVSSVKCQEWFWKISRYAFGISAIFLFFVAGYLTFQQYQIWLANPMARLLLPPHQPINYFAQYALTHFWTNLLIVLAASLLALVAAKLLNKRFQERFFLPEEPWLFATALLLVGHPGWTYYALALFGAALLVSSIKYSAGGGSSSGGQVSRNKEWRFSFYYLWLPIAISAIIILRALNTR